MVTVPANRIRGGLPLVHNSLKPSRTAGTGKETAKRSAKASGFFFPVRA